MWWGRGFGTFVSMADFTESRISIDADPGTVSDVIADVEAYPEWTSQMRTVTVLSTDEADYPEQVEFTIDAGVFQDTYVLDYTWDLEEDGQGVVSWTLVRGDVLKAMTGSYTLSGDATGTTVVYRLSVDVKIPMPGLLKRKAEKSIISGALGGLKKRCEG